MPNRLANETSPYLVQHKDNPVDWYAWGDEAFAAAKSGDKPILLSVGYSACHWCHVMAHESFENERIAALMNDKFVNIKVDREERPDVDAIYMQAVQALTGRGGWPMTVFLTPDAIPFYGGTYYPPEDRGGMPGFPRVLVAVADAYKTKRDDLLRAGNQLVSHITSTTEVRPGSSELGPELLDEAFEAVMGSYDAEFGGFGQAPKFPQPMVLDFLLRYHKRTEKPNALEAVERTLRAMAHGGMYDQVGGGFHRYSTDAVWLVPHFEKMLYDNAQLARVYLGAFKVTGDALYRRIAQETLDYVRREMTHPDGGFYSTQDADSEGEEGKFFVWTPGEIESVLGPDAALVGKYFGVSEAGNFEGSNILNIPVPPERFLQDNDIDGVAFEAQVQAAKSKLYQAREERIHPGRDEKVITAWNGMMQRAFAEAALAVDSQEYRDAATRNADFLLREMRPQGRLLRTWKDGVAKLNGYLEDYACLIDGLLATYAATFEPRFLGEAILLTDEMLDLFWDDEVQGFFDTGRDHEDLITRPRDFFDNATPSGTSVAADVLLRLAVLTENADYERRAVACLQALTPFIERAPTGFGHLLCALDFHLSRSQELAVIWPIEGANGQTGKRAKEGGSEVLLDAVRDLYLPNLLLVGAREGEGGELTPLLRDRPALDGKPTAYLCERFVCEAPTTDPAQLRQQLEEA